MSWSKHAKIYFLGITGLSFCLLLMEVLAEVHVPGTDIFLFKEAGVNLALKGKFVASYLPHMPFGAEKTFAYYPPLYPFFFGVWSWLFGVGLLQSLAFNSTLTLLRTSLLLFLVMSRLPANFFSEKKRVIRRATGIFFVLLCLISTDRDRPDELALFFGLLMIATLESRYRLGVKILGASLLLAMTGATSPACGALFGLCGLVWTLLQKKRVSSFLALSLGAVSFWSLMILPIIMKDMASGLRFSKQVGLSSFPYLKNIYHWSQWKLLLDQFSWNIRSFYFTGQSYVWMAVLVVVLTVLSLKRRSKENLIFAAPLLYALSVPFIWTLQPYYLWFPSILLLIYVVRSLAIASTFPSWGIVGGLYIAITPLLFWEAKCIYNAFWVPDLERRATIRELVLNEIGPRARLGITHDQYFTFRDKKEVINVDYWAHQLSHFDYLYVTDLPDSTRRNRKERKILSQDSEQCFEKVRDYSTYQELPTPRSQIHYVRGNGGVLLRNKCRLGKITLKNQPGEKTTEEAAG